jgi:hypothetical protein
MPALPDGWTQRKMKLAILERVAASQNQRDAKSNLVGRSATDRGNLERALNLTFSEEQRGAVYLLVQELGAAGYLQPSFGQMGGGEDWVALTDAGRRAIERHALDELDEALLAIREELVEVREGMWAAFHSGRADSLRQAAHSARELIRQVIDALAPLDRVREATWFQRHEGSSSGVTRRQRVRLILEDHGRGRGDEELVEGLCDQVDTNYGRLSGQAHADSQPASADVKDLLDLAEIALKRLLCRT